MAERRRRTVVAVSGVIVIFAVLMVVHHVRGTPPPDRPAVAKPVVFSVGISDCTFVDTTRGTPDYLNGTEQKDRVLTTEIRYPTLSPARGVAETPSAHPAVGHGPYPLVVFGHGFALNPDTYSTLLDHWVRSGFVVAAPLFPDTNERAVDALPVSDNSTAEDDDINQPGDLDFLTKALVAADSGSSPACTVLHGLLASGKIALAGQSDGATSALGLAYDPKFVKSAIPYRAVVDLSGEQFGAGTSSPDALGGASTPLLVSQSAADACNPPQYGTAVYDAVTTKDKWFLELKTVHHLPPYIGTNVPAFDEVVRVTTAFLTDEFAGKRPGSALMRSANADPAVAVLSGGPTAPDLAPLTQSFGACYLQS